MFPFYLLLFCVFSARSCSETCYKTFIACSSYWFSFSTYSNHFHINSAISKHKTHIWIATPFCVCIWLLSFRFKTTNSYHEVREHNMNKVFPTRSFDCIYYSPQSFFLYLSNSGVFIRTYESSNWGFLATNFSSQALKRENLNRRKEIKSVIRTSCDKIVLLWFMFSCFIQLSFRKMWKIRNVHGSCRSIKKRERKCFKRTKLLLNFCNTRFLEWTSSKL